ncbi:MAG: hypothetical protein NTV25_00200 [Methanothrix sp.]|jgi:hypothetical protein|nr:hypothetical protein [Methanothrix sp.]
MGDSAVDISMDSYDEFVRNNIQKSSVDLPAAKAAAQSRLGLDLGDQSHIDLILSQAGGELSGLGNMTWANQTEQVKATGSLRGNKLSLEVATLSNMIYKFDLAKKGSAVLGDYSQIDPEGRKLRGIADGRWET